MPKLPTRVFSSHPGPLVEQPDLIAIQRDSYEWFKKEGVKEIFEEFSPIKDYSSHNLDLHFLDYYFGDPKYTETEAKIKSITYSAPLRANLKLTIGGAKNGKEQEVYLGDFPMMTDRGTFIINGVERVVISQLVRSPGVYFLAEYRVDNSLRIFDARQIPRPEPLVNLQVRFVGGVGGVLL